MAEAVHPGTFGCCIKKELESIGNSLNVNKLLSKGFTGEGANELKTQFGKFSTELVSSFNENQVRILICLRTGNIFHSFYQSDFFYNIFQIF